MLVPTGERRVTGRPVLLTLEAAGRAAGGRGGGGEGGGGRGAELEELQLTASWPSPCWGPVFGPHSVRGWRYSSRLLSELGPSLAPVETESQAPAGAEPEVEPRGVPSLPHRRGHRDTGQACAQTS